MLKVMPSFKGDSNDYFESWVLSVKKCLSYGWNCTEQQKLDVVITKIAGYASQTLEYDRENKNLDMPFQAMKKSYGKDQRAIISNVKQFPTKSANRFV